MRLIERTVSVNPDTFAPEVYLTVALALDSLQDASAHLDELELAIALGKELLELLGGGKE